MAHFGPSISGFVKEMQPIAELLWKEKELKLK